jgi:ADP-ribose pyrophosphatase YjhB (NUDIX family)
MEMSGSSPGTAVRDVREETGLNIEITGPVDTYTDSRHAIACTDGEVRRQCNICFTAHIAGGELAIPDESTQLRFVPSAELDIPPRTTPGDSVPSTMEQRDHLHLG